MSDRRRTVSRVAAVLLTMLMLCGVLPAAKVYAANWEFSELEAGDIIVEGDFILNAEDFWILYEIDETNHWAALSDYGVLSYEGISQWQVRMKDFEYSSINVIPLVNTYTPCEHDHEWVTRTEATALTAGWKDYKCKKCGHIEQSLEISGFSAFLQQVADSVTGAEKDAEVTVCTTMWMSFNQTVFNALAARPDVTLTVKYWYGGKYYTCTIPSGADLSGLLNEDGYCGFRNLDSVFGGTEAEG